VKRKFFYINFFRALPFSLPLPRTPERQLRIRMNSIPGTSIEYLKGAGTVKADLLKKESGIHTSGDLLMACGPAFYALNL
jgi:hypothetical protein